ncbi:MAG TPA: S53 family peptidase, partial [Bryobacteraceae bacterium]|nr:S53 family peptidase [Bryobacteraceae bacterium]
MSKRVPLALAVGLVLCAGAQNLAAQRNRIAAPVDRRDTVRLTGHIHPLATAANERGRADASMPMPGITLFFRPTADQQKALDDLLARQQDPGSPDYHNWLTPEQYADRFGLSQADMAKIRAWLESEGFTIALTARGRNSITFSGTAGQVEKTFQTEIHRYFVDGQMHYANSTEPSIPAALGGIVGSIRGLHDFKPRPPRARITQPRYDNPPNQGGGYQIAPDDAAVIYDYKTLYSQNINGAGQNVVIVGQVQIATSDIAAFRTMFNLPASAPTLVPVPNLPLPPTGAQDSGDLGESDLDIETVGGVARGATVIFVYSNNVEDAITYAIDQNLAPVLSSSYGLCEALATQPGTLSDQTLAEQANAQGMTWLSAAGDNGAVDCYGQVKGDPGLGVDEPGSIPQVTSVGGTELNEGSGNYWASTNNASDASALSYIPETTWNDSAIDGTASASGGGSSMFFTRPSWQTGSGTFSSDGMRDVPDVSFSASADHDGWLIYSGGSLSIFGGTSVSAPLFAGILTLLNQYEVVNGYQKTPGLGNVNPKLY